MGRPTHSQDPRVDTAKRFELLRDVRGGDGATDTHTVTTGATQPSGLNHFGIC
jgi:hypothetical protein